MPTTYPDVTAEELRALGVRGVIYANQGLRGAARAMMSVAQRILSSGSSRSVEPEILPMSAIYDMQGMDDLLRKQDSWERQGGQVAELVERAPAFRLAGGV